jgi:hypothetical protein
VIIKGRSRISAIRQLIVDSVRIVVNGELTTPSGEPPSSLLPVTCHIKLALMNSASQLIESRIVFNSSRLSATICTQPKERADVNGIYAIDIIGNLTTWSGHVISATRGHGLVVTIASNSSLISSVTTLHSNRNVISHCVLVFLCPTGSQSSYSIRR